MLQAELRVLSGKHAGNTIQLPHGKFLVGREEDCHLRPNTDLVSRHHCVFTLDEYGLRFRDLGSTNGSFVNGEQLRGSVVLNSGDKVGFGKLEFQVVIGDPITEETRTNLSNDLPTEIMVPAEGEEAPAIGNESQEDTIQEVSTADTMMDIPAQPLADSGQVTPPEGETQYFPPQGGVPPQMPVGYPPQMYPQGMMPYGYPGYPQQMPGYPPQMPGYPPQQMPGYAPQQMPGYPPQQGEAETAPASSSEEMPVRLPDPSETGAKAPAAPAPVEKQEGEEDTRTADQKAKEEAPSAAADAIQQYLQRRPNVGGK